MIKKTNGFTLIELLAVIVILSILLSVSVIAVNNIRKNQEQENVQNTISSILTGAKRYVSDNKSILDKDLSSIEINVSTLINGSYVDFDTKNKQLSNLPNEKVKVESCEDSNLKLKYYIIYEGTKYNDCGCSTQNDEVAEKICID